MRIGFSVNGAEIPFRALAAEKQFDGKNHQGKADDSDRHQRFTVAPFGSGEEPGYHQPDHPEPGITGMCEERAYPPPSFHFWFKAQGIRPANIQRCQSSDQRVPF